MPEDYDYTFSDVGSTTTNVTLVGSLEPMKGILA